MRIIGLLISITIMAVGGYYLFFGQEGGDGFDGGRVDIEQTILISREATRHSHMISIATAINLAVLEREGFNSIVEVVLACSSANSVEDLGEGRLFEIDVFDCGISSIETEDPLGGNYRIEVIDDRDRSIRLYASQEATESEFYSNPKIY